MLKPLFRLLPRIALLVLLLAPPSPAWACSCVPPDPPPIAFANMEAVFVGNVTQISDPSWPGGLVSSADPVRVVLQVNDSWKGVTTATVLVETAVSGASCGYTFDVGRQYVVYAYDHDNNGVWATNMCTRTNDVANAAADLTYLNTLPKLALISTPPPVPVAVYVIGAAVGLVLAIVSVWLIAQLTKREPSGE